MPIRITCPSCSATLSVKDEFAGRAVKCPKCGGVIPPAQPAASPLPPPPLATPERSPFETLDEPEKPASKITGKPVARSKADDREEDDRPRRKRRDEDDERDEPRARNHRDDRDDDDRPRRKRRDEDERDDKGARPAKKRRREDDDDGPPRKSSSSTTLIVLGVIGLGLLTCCGGTGVLFWSGFQKARQDEIAENKGDDPYTSNPATITDPALRVKVSDLLANYRRDPEFAAGKWGGKKYLIEFTLADALEDADGQPVIAHDSDKGFRRPTVVARLVNRKGVKAGWIHCYIEGTIKGPIPVKDATWFSKWAELPVDFGAIEGAVLVIEDARIVPEPKK